MLEKMLALQNKRKKEGGFTLVELIVVLVILAILAALLIPALTGYIDKAKEKSIIAETRQTVMAAQTLYDEAYGTVKMGATAPDFTNDKTSGTTVTKPNIGYSEVATLAEVDVKNIDEIKATANKISSLKYSRDGKTCTYNGSTYTVDKSSTEIGRAHV